MRAAALIIALFVLAACAKEAEQEAQSTNDKFRVERLFETDGCRVYRFFDQWNYRYFTNCSGQASWTESCGKGCTRDVTVSGGRREQQ